MKHRRPIRLPWESHPISVAKYNPGKRDVACATSLRIIGNGSTGKSTESYFLILEYYSLRKGLTMSKQPIGKTLLRNVIRHTDAHNKIQEEMEMWKMRDWEIQTSHNKQILDTECVRGRMHCDRVPDQSRGLSRSRERDSEQDNREAWYWTRKLYEFEAGDPDRWGHSGFRELYPEEFESDSKKNSSTKKIGRYKMKKSKSDTEATLSKHSKKSSRKKKKKKKKKDEEKRKKAKCSSSDDSSDDSSPTKDKQRRKRTKSRHKNKKNRNRTPTKTQTRGWTQKRRGKIGKPQVRRAHMTVLQTEKRRCGQTLCSDINKTLLSDLSVGVLCRCISSPLQCWTHTVQQYRLLEERCGVSTTCHIKNSVSCRLIDSSLTGVSDCLACA
ncbi:hypothetical protein Q8A73_006462 [Channa argus]|nr:hypothetical protein Q8A73_006462 [Channa argus]